MHEKRLDVYGCFRFLKHNIRHLTYISEDLDSGNVCPACSQVKYSLNRVNVLIHMSNIENV